MNQVDLLSKFDFRDNFILFEFNCNDLDGPTLRDTSGNGCKAVLLGDYAISKEEEDMPSVRDSFIDFPQETGGDKGAF